jgi:hypothetical protein
MIQPKFKIGDIFVKILKKKEILICEDCQIIGGTTEKTVCPYQLYLYDIEVGVCLCDKCYEQRFQDT